MGMWRTSPYTTDLFHAPQEEENLLGIIPYMCTGPVRLTCSSHQSFANELENIQKNVMLIHHSVAPESKQAQELKKMC